jgi:hypothetical protein
LSKTEIGISILAGTGVQTLTFQVALPSPLARQSRLYTHTSDFASAVGIRLMVGVQIAQIIHGIFCTRKLDGMGCEDYACTLVQGLKEMTHAAAKDVPKQGEVRGWVLVLALCGQAIFDFLKRLLARPKRSQMSLEERSLGLLALRSMLAFLEDNAHEWSVVLCPEKTRHLRNCLGYYLLKLSSSDAQGQSILELRDKYRRIDKVPIWLSIFDNFRDNHYDNPSDSEVSVEELSDSDISGDCSSNDGNSEGYTSDH